MNGAEAVLSRMPEGKAKEICKAFARAVLREEARQDAARRQAEQAAIDDLRKQELWD